MSIWEVVPISFFKVKSPLVHLGETFLLIVMDSLKYENSGMYPLCPWVLVYDLKCHPCSTCEERIEVLEVPYVSLASLKKYARLEGPVSWISCLSFCDLIRRFLRFEMQNFKLNLALSHGLIVNALCFAS